VQKNEAYVGLSDVLKPSRTKWCMVGASAGGGGHQPARHTGELVEGVWGESNTQGGERQATQHAVAQQSTAGSAGRCLWAWLRRQCVVTINMCASIGHANTMGCTCRLRAHFQRRVRQYQNPELTC
jgi:hypothetical protein